MTASEILDKAHLERVKWHNKNYRKGKFILGIEVLNILKSSVEFQSHANHYERTLLGYPYVEDAEDEMCINFCPIEE